MRFKLQTLVDITETGARRTDETKKYRQQQNWMTLLQTLGLRSNPIITKQTFESKGAKSTGFGTDYKGSQRVWTVEFEIEREGSLSLDMLIEDFEFVPIIVGLDETVEFEKSIFSTRDPKSINITFSEI